MPANSRWDLIRRLRVKRLQRKRNHRPPSSAKVKNEWSYTTPSYFFAACKETTLLSHFEQQITDTSNE